MRRLRTSRVPALLAVAALAFGLVHTVPPVSANHQFDYWHWRSSPQGAVVVPEIIDRNRTFRDGLSIAADAGDWWWFETGNRYGPYGSGTDGRGGGDCSPVLWTIVVCLAHHPNAPPNWAMYMQPNWWNYEGTTHMAACAIYINPAWANTVPSTDSLKRLMRHEMGHCAGLGHNVWEGNSIMVSSPGTILTAHDQAAMSAQYWDHWH